MGPPPIPGAALPPMDATMLRSQCGRGPRRRDRECGSEQAPLGRAEGLPATDAVRTVFENGHSTRQRRRPSTAMPSRAPPEDPGRLMIKVLLAIPAIPRLNTAVGTP